MDELNKIEKIEETERIRRPGAGRKRIEIKDPTIIKDLEKIMKENTACDPMNFLKWTNKSTYTIANELKKSGQKIRQDTVSRLLKEQNYSLQANVKTIEGNSVPERDEQFKYISKQVREFIKNNGSVNVGTSYDTSEFAVESIQQCWNLIGKIHYPNAKNLLICADGGGSNGSRRRGWKFFLQEFADQAKISISVSHLPPGTSKWNKIEHRMFSFISMNWKGKPLVNYETVINLISSTTTKKGLIVVARLDEGVYEKRRKFT